MQTKQYTLILLLILCLGAFSSKAFTDLYPQKSRPTDSIMNLMYKPDSYLGTLRALEKMDKGIASSLDSAVTFVNNLPGCWAMSPVYKYRLMRLRHYQISGYAKMVSKEYAVFDKIEKEYPPSTDPNNGMMEVDKPVIYLYAITETNINVNLGFAGADLYTWPKIDAKNNWNVIAQPDGMLKDAAGEEYPYLFWEGKMDNFSWVDMNEGFVVPANETETFFRDKLKYLGLNSREYTDFITFWAPKMKDSAYNFIRFETTAYIGEVPLTVTPKPESSQRILMVYKGLEEPITVKEQVLKPFTRKGFTLIEWGGTAMPTIVN